MDTESSSRGTTQKKPTTYGLLSHRKSSLVGNVGVVDSTHEAKPNAQSPVACQSSRCGQGTAVRFDDAEMGPPDHKAQIDQQYGGRKRKRQEDSLSNSIRSTPSRQEGCGDNASNAFKKDGRAPDTTVWDFNEEEAEERTRPRIASVMPATFKTPVKVGSSSPSNDKRGNGSQSVSRRPRLIDALTAQKEPRSAKRTLQARALGDGTGSPIARRMTPTQDSKSRAADRRTTTPTSRKIKLTYSHSRSLQLESTGLEESALLEPDLSANAALAETHTFADPKNDDDVEDNASDDASSQFAIKSVHELRRSGANNRFADEMDDMLARIGTPGNGSLTMRRNALCELAQLLPQDGFAAQFRDHGSRDKVAQFIGAEKDLISGFALTASLLLFFKSGPAPHLVHQLSQHGLGQLLGRLLQESQDIDTLGAQRAMNLPRTTRTSLHKVRESLIGMSMWHGLEPTHLSPRIGALLLLELFGHYADAQDLEKIARQLDKNLLAVVVEYAKPETTVDDIGSVYTVFALEALSSAGISIESDMKSASRARLPRSVAGYLRRAARRWPVGRGEFEAATFKLAINITNTAKGAEAFDGGILSLLADCIEKGIGKVKDAISSGSLEGNLYDELLLLLGVMINIVEHNASARISIEEEALDRLVNLWQRNRRVISEADSVDKSKVSVAISYLAVFLGYACLTERGSERIKALAEDGEGISNLIRSIRNFVDMYKTVDSKAHELEALVDELSK